MTATGAQHEEDRIHGATIIDARPVAAQRMRRSRRQQRLDPLPHRIGHPPVPHFLHAARSVRRIHASTFAAVLLPLSSTQWSNGIGSKTRPDTNASSSVVRCHLTATEASTTTASVAKAP